MQKLFFMQAKPKNRTNQNHTKNPNTTSPQTRKKPNTYKYTQIYKRAQNLQTLTSTHKPPKITQNKTKKPRTKKTQKPKKIHKKQPPPNPPKSQTPYPLSQIFANPLFVAYQHLSRKIPRFPNHTPCQSSSLLVAYFDLPLCQRHT